MESDRNSLERLSMVDKALNAVNNCPHNEVLHFHHDGCPACDYVEIPLKIGTSTYTKDAQKMELVKEMIMSDVSEDEMINNPDDGSWKGR